VRIATTMMITMRTGRIAMIAALLFARFRREIPVTDGQSLSMRVLSGGIWLREARLVRAQQAAEIRANAMTMTCARQIRALQAAV
jgi:hypothetical protein